MWCFRFASERNVVSSFLFQKKCGVFVLLPKEIWCFRVYEEFRLDSNFRKKGFSLGVFEIWPKLVKKKENTYTAKMNNFKEEDISSHIFHFKVTLYNLSDSDPRH